MIADAVVQVGLFLALLVALAVPLGEFLAWIYSGQSPLVRATLKAEELFFRIAGAQGAMSWKDYAVAVVVFNTAGALVVYGLLRLQGGLPLNPAGLAGVSPEVAFNTAVSFATNTNWQAYGGETTMSHLSQMAALTVQNFVSAATGMAVLVALARGLAGKGVERLGNFWVDLVRGTVWGLVPLSAVVTVLLMARGVPQTFSGSATVPLVDPAGEVTEQVLALGPVASQVAIKQLGTNGGGFYNVNSAHPLENPDAVSNLIEVLSILWIPAALCFTFGALIGDRRQGWALFAAMMAIFVPAVAVTIWAEAAGNPALLALGVDDVGNLEGKEVRFGIVGSALWAVATTAASNGSVNAMHDSFTPLGGLVPMWMMQLGEVVFGGVGSGLYGMLMYALIAVFVAGLMVGRTPEYLGKKVEAFEIKMASLAILLPSITVLLGTALALLVPAGTATLGNPGTHGFSEVLYAFSSGANNNGSAFGGITVSGPFYAGAIGVAMWIGRFGVLVPVLAIAGSMGRKTPAPPSAGTLPTHTPMFVGLLVATVLLVGALTFVPALALGPVVEHLALSR